MSTAGFIDRLPWVGGIAGGRARAIRPGLDLEWALEERLVRDLESGELEEAVPFRRAVVAHVARITETVGLLRGFADERVVADHDAVLRDTRHLLDGGDDVGEVVRRDAA